MDRAHTGRPQVALTFHGAGDPALARRLLDVADSRGAKVTVLAIGTWLAAHPELADRVLSAGHELGNHTMTHPVLRRLRPSAIDAEISRCREVLEKVSGSPGAYFRPSGGAGSTAAIRAASARAGYRTLLGFDVDPRDYADPGATAVVKRALASIKPGSVLSLHLGHAGTVSALPHLLDGLQARGLAPVTASELLAP